MLVKLVIVVVLLLGIGALFPIPLVLTALATIATVIAGAWTVYGLRYVRSLSDPH
jgi:hypothetical protein